MLGKKKKVEASQNDDFFSDGEEGAVAEHEPMPDVEPAKKQAPRSRLLLLLLLLVAIAGGAYFYLLPPAEEPPPPMPPQTAVRKPIPAPPAPAAQANAGAQVTPAAPAPAPAKEAPAPAAAVAKQAVPPAPAAPAPTKEMATAAKAAEAKPVTAAPAKEAPASAATAGKSAPAAKAAPVAGNYTIEAGAFLVKANREAVEKTITRLGYQPKITVIQRPVKMLRLRVGGPYPPMLAEAKLAEVAQFAPKAFSVPNGDQLVVYAGSFFLVDEARTLADQLYTEGIRVEEETAQVKMPLEMVTFGSFASKDAAAEALAKAKAAGLPAIIVRK